MTETEKLNTQLSQIRRKIEKNTKSQSGKKSASQMKLLQRERDKLNKQEKKILADLQKAVKTAEKKQEREVKKLNDGIKGRDMKIDSLQRQVPMTAVEVDDFDIEV